MKDLTLKFHDKLQFKAFLSSLGWAEDEDLQNTGDQPTKMMHRKPFPAMALLPKV